MIKILTNLIIAILMAFWLGTISVFSIQNITAVSLKFFIWQSIQLPVGILLTLCVGVGLILGALLPILWQPSNAKRKRRLARETEY